MHCMSLCVCVFVCGVCVCKYVCLHVYAPGWMTENHISIGMIRVCVCVCVCVCMRLPLCKVLSIHVSVCLLVCIYVCLRVYMCV